MFIYINISDYFINHKILILLENNILRNLFPIDKIKIKRIILN